MLNEFDAFAHDIILKRSEIAHAEMCSTPDNCGNWHIRNDFIPRIRREVMAEMESALKNLSRRGLNSALKARTASINGDNGSYVDHSDFRVGVDTRVGVA